MSFRSILTAFKKFGLKYYVFFTKYGIFLINLTAFWVILRSFPTFFCVFTFFSDKICVKIYLSVRIFSVFIKIRA